MTMRKRRRAYYARQPLHMLLILRRAEWEWERTKDLFMHTGGPLRQLKKRVQQQDTFISGNFPDPKPERLWDGTTGTIHGYAVICAGAKNG